MCYQLSLNRLYNIPVIFSRSPSLMSLCPLRAATSLPSSCRVFKTFISSLYSSFQTLEPSFSQGFLPSAPLSSSWAHCRSFLFDGKWCLLVTCLGIERTFSLNVSSSSKHYTLKVDKLTNTAIAPSLGRKSRPEFGTAMD